MKNTLKLLAVVFAFVTTQAFAVPTVCPSAKKVATAKVKQMIKDDEGNVLGLGALRDSGIKWALIVTADNLTDTSGASLRNAQNQVKTVKGPIYDQPENPKDYPDAYLCYYPGEQKTHTFVGLVYIDE